MMSVFDDFDKQFGFSSFNDDFFDRHLGFKNDLYRNSNNQQKRLKTHQHSQNNTTTNNQQQQLQDNSQTSSTDTNNQQQQSNINNQQLTTQQPANSSSQQLSTTNSRTHPLDLWNAWNNQLSLFNDKLSTMGNIKVDLVENKDNYLVNAEVAGFNKDDIKLNIDSGLLTISASHSNEKHDEDKSRNYIYRERSMNSVQRTIKLPKDIKHDDISAKFDNGILSINLPRTERKEQQAIKID